MLDLQHTQYSRDPSIIINILVARHTSPIAGTENICTINKGSMHRTVTRILMCWNVNDDPAYYNVTQCCIVDTMLNVSLHHHAPLVINRALPNVSMYIRVILKREKLSEEAESMRARYDSLLSALEQGSGVNHLRPVSIIGDDDSGYFSGNRTRGKRSVCVSGARVCMSYRGVLSVARLMC